MKVIGITGGVGAGKSAVLAYLKEKHHAYVIQADEVGHLVMEPGGSCYESVIRLFGEKIVKSDKTIDRSMVSDVVFHREELLRELNAVIHPAVRAYIRSRMEEQRQAGCPLFVVEAALLLEDHYESFCDEVWYIHADTGVRIARLMENRGYTREKAESIIANQATEDFFRAHADYVVENSGDLSHTYEQIDRGVS